MKSFFKLSLFPRHWVASFNNFRPIAELENKITRAHVIDTSKLDNSKVAFGATVEITELETETKTSYKIVGVDEADIEQNLISVSAPLCKAMINKKVKDIFEVNTPKGLKEYQINSIKFL